MQIEPMPATMNTTTTFPSRLSNVDPKQIIQFHGGGAMMPEVVGGFLATIGPPDESRKCRRGQSFGPGLEPYGDLVSPFLSGASVDRPNRVSGGKGTARDPFWKENFGHLQALPPRARDASARLPIWKRALDLVIILLSWPLWIPLMLLIAVAIKTTSAGPVFYRQERVGYRGRRFMLFKFRTMRMSIDTRVHEAHVHQLMSTDSPMTKLDALGDPRLIKCGRFLRAAGFDELPQILNVLRGEMSLVGVRPCTVREFEHYQPWQRERVDAPPGLTGYWQVNGKNKTTFSEMIEMDIFYGKKMSLWLDVLIMFQTIPAIVLTVLETHGVTFVEHSPGDRTRRLRRAANYSTSRRHAAAHQPA